MGKWEDIWGSEWPYVQRIGRAISDPEEKRQYWENLKRMKEADPSLSIYTLFPPASDSKRMALKYSTEILEMLRGRKRDDSDVEKESKE